MDGPLCRATGGRRDPGSERQSTLVNGEWTVALSSGAQLAFARPSDGTTVLVERVEATAEWPGRVFTPRGGTWYLS